MADEQPERALGDLRLRWDYEGGYNRVVLERCAMVSFKGRARWQVILGCRAERLAGGVWSASVDFVESPKLRTIVTDEELRACASSDGSVAVDRLRRLMEKAEVAYRLGGGG